jgi:hypothetical protein
VLPPGESLVDDAGVSLSGLAGGGIRECKRNHVRKDWRMAEQTPRC